MNILSYKIGFLLILVSISSIWSQNDIINMNAVLNPATNSLEINQIINYKNRTEHEMHSIFFHDWNHAYSDKNSSLGKRFLENYSKKFFFTSEKNRGYTNIHSFLANDESVIWKRESQAIDQIEIFLNKPLLPNESVTFEIDYQVKLPNAKFSGYGVDKENFNLKYWYIVPAVYENGWQTMSNLDMDDLYQNLTDYHVSISVPEKYNVFSNLEVQTIGNGKYKLSGNSILNFELEIATETNYQKFKTDSLLVETNLNSVELENNVKKDILNRQLVFLNDYLGVFSQKKIFINKTSYEKNPLFGLNQLPDFLRPFSDTFEWDLRMFQTLSKVYIDQSIVSNTRRDVWLREGLPHYLMMKYVDEFYPDKKLIGNISKIWGIKFYHIAKMNFNERYLFAYQYVTRQNHDQALNVVTDSLSNYNREIANRFKTALSLNYLDDYLGDQIIKKSTSVFFTSNLSKSQGSESFKNSVENLTTKDVNWFFQNYLSSDHNFDFKIKDLVKKKDSVQFEVRGGLINMPISIYGIQKNKIISKYWFIQADSIQQITLPNLDESKWMLNYEGKIPEVDLKNNWKNSNFQLFKRPPSIRLFRDAEDYKHTQLFLYPKVFYNYYDGFSVAGNFSNRTLFRKSIEYSVTPIYGLKSETLTGTYALNYLKYPEVSKINSYNAGIFGIYSHYKPELKYRTFSAYAQVFFKRDNVRSVKGKALAAYYTMVNKDPDPLLAENEVPYKYGVFHLKFFYNNPALINSFLFSSNFEVGTNFSKLYTEFRYRKLTNSNQQFEARLFTGLFLSNNTNSDYFSFAVNRPNDYLFRYNYYGRSESSGFFSQQFIMNDGGFKAEMPVKFANQWITSLNTSIGIWKWFEIYNDVGLIKNKNKSVFFVHENGIRIDIVNNFLELYFPLYSNNGWEISQPNYNEKIRFVLTTDVREIFSFFKRGYM